MRIVLYISMILGAAGFRSVDVTASLLYASVWKFVDISSAVDDIAIPVCSFTKVKDKEVFLLYITSQWNDISQAF